MAMLQSTPTAVDVASDALLDARSLIVAVQSSSLPGQDLFERLQFALVALDDGIALVRS